MPTNIPRISKPSPKDLQISWVTNRSWSIHESPGLKPDWLGDIKLFSVKNLYILLYIILSNIFPATGSKGIGQ